MPPAFRRHPSALAARIADRRRARGARASLAAPTPIAGQLEKPQRARSAPRGDEAPFPDLLNADGRPSLDAEALIDAFDFAFAAGDDGGAWDRALAQAPIAASTWDPAHFATDLFLEDFVALCMTPAIGGREVQVDEAQLLRLFSRPPAEPRSVEQRRAVLTELAARPAAREAVEALYLRLAELRELFRGSGVVVRGDLAERRLDIVKKLASVFDALVAPALAESESALVRAYDYGSAVRASAAFARLRELAEYDERRAHADLRVRLGADGRVRALEVIGVRENLENRYHRSALARWWSRLSLLLRGYRLTEGEIADRWLDSVFEGILPQLPPLVQLMGDLEFYLAALSFRDRCEARGLAVCFPELVDEGESAASGLFNPLLFAQGITPVPCALERPPGARITLITGPNSGGKTRLLQARALLQLCAEGGLFAPAASARVRRATGLFASLQEEASVGQREGRLGMELVRIRTLFERAEPGYLIVVDELCSGTNPSEGEEMFRLVLELLRGFDPEVYISTHFLQFAAALGPEADALGLAFLQVELDLELRPTYGFVPGVAQTSLAHQTAARLGVTREELMALVRQKRRRE